MTVIPKKRSEKGGTEPTTVRSQEVRGGGEKGIRYFKWFVLKQKEISSLTLAFMMAFWSLGDHLKNLYQEQHVLTSSEAQHSACIGYVCHEQLNVIRC